jgi:hypothetical protein
MVMDDIITISTTDQTNTIDLSDIKPVEFSWNESDMSTGIVAQEIGTEYSTMITAPSTVTLGSGVSIKNLQIGASNPGYTISTPFDDIVERLSKLEQIISEEEEVRRTHPAVQMAYDEYRLLMILSKKNPGDFLTED